jgi:hypothetical protein
MALASLQFRPGIVKDVTDYTNEGGWVDGDHVRFRMGFPEKIGGWQRIGEDRYIGVARSAHRWTALNGSEYLGVGTHRKFYIFFGDVFRDITPLRLTTTAGAATFSVITAAVDNIGISASSLAVFLDSVAGFFSPSRIAINSEVIGFENIVGSSALGPLIRGMAGTTPAAHSLTDLVSSPFIKVTHTAHGAQAGDFVTFSGAAGLGGNITAGVLNQEYTVFRVLDANNYLILARQAATPMSFSVDDSLQRPLDPDGYLNAVYPNASDTGDGGAGVVAAYQINSGLEHSVLGTGWGAGGWGAGGWGDPAAVGIEGQSALIWSQDNFGEFLLAAARGSSIYYWDPDTGFGQRLRPLESLSGANQTPTACLQVMVSDVDRHVLAFGTTPEGSSVLDPLLIRFSNQEDLEEWESTALTTAGELRLGTGSTFVVAVATRQQTIVFTDISMYALQFIGPPFIFGVTELAFGTSILGPNAIIAVRDQLFWMGYGGFYTFNGRVQELQCPLRDYIFTRLNETQKDKVFAAHNSRFSEIWWFYPSTDGLEIDSYVCYNYEQDVWVIGAMGRTAWIDRGRHPTPIGFGDGRPYDHEVGADADGEPLDAFIQSAPIDIDDGHHFVFAGRVIPDVTFRDSPASSPEVTMTVFAWDRPGEEIRQDEDRPVERSAPLPVETYTRQLDIRLRGRAFSIRVESEDLGVKWRLGTPRIDIRPDGRR